MPVAWLGLYLGHASSLLPMLMLAQAFVYLRDYAALALVALALVSLLHSGSWLGSMLCV